jgi:outer membrane protein
MKNGLLIWNVVLTALVGYLLFIQFRPAKTADARTTKTATNSQVANSSFKIAYFEMDSVEDNFDMVKSIKEEMNKKEEAITNELSRLSKNFQQRYNYLQTQAQSGKLSQEQSEAAGKELNSLDEQLKMRKQELDQQYNDFRLRKGKEVKTMIEDFLKEYNQDKGYSFIMTNEPGFMYYRDTLLNITSEVIQGLNDKHRNKKN